MQQMSSCPNCGARSAGQQFCTSCGARMPAEVQQQAWGAQPAPGAPTATREAVPGQKYAALRAVATIYKIIGWVVMVGGSLFSIALAVIAAQGTEGFSEFIPWASGVGMVGIAIVGVIVSVLYGLFLLAFADLCYVLMDIERNTRAKERA
ncbi:MAG: zinc ribbon domain-containing protein [Chloroflexi bacterium]|nr:zinc ribbon domain-containing protein [Chloroflexota bacterium]